jgi:hypothetical protein
MDIETYKLSRTFLFQHHTLRTMRDILNGALPHYDIPKMEDVMCILTACRTNEVM